MRTDKAPAVEVASRPQNAAEDLATTFLHAVLTRGQVVRELPS
jgi:hypothetical protein